MEQTQGLNKSLSFVHVYALATGAIFTFVAYWDTVFVSYCGPATWLAFATMTVAVLPIAFTYCEITPFFPQAGAELIYNTVAYKNKYIGFFSAWAIMMAWIAVPPAAVMAIIEWVTNVVFDMQLSIGTITIIYDLVVALLTGIAFRDVSRALYSGVAIFVSGKIMDAVVYRFDYSKVALIISPQYEEIARVIAARLDRGATFLNGEGSFSRKDTKVVLTAVKRQQLAELKALVVEIDPNAFIIMQEAHQVLGDGFARYSKDAL